MVMGPLKAEYNQDKLSNCHKSVTDTLLEYTCLNYREDTNLSYKDFVSFSITGKYICPISILSGIALDDIKIYREKSKVLHWTHSVFMLDMHSEVS